MEQKKVTLIVPSTWLGDFGREYSTAQSIFEENNPRLKQLLHTNSFTIDTIQSMPFHDCMNTLMGTDYGTKYVIIVLGTPLPFQINEYTLGSLCHHKGWLAVQYDQVLNQSGFFLEKDALSICFNSFMHKE